MKAFLLTFSALALLTTPAAAQLATTAKRPAVVASSTPTADEQLFTGLVEQLGTAIQKHDMAAMAGYMAPEYVHYNPSNSSGNRTEELAYLDKWGPTTVKLVGPVKVNRYGNAAVTVSTSNFSGVENGKAFSNTMQMMIAWVLRDGKWQMAVVQSKMLPA
ncbi:nuclear transport factor 2 family protein [Hymenobacter sp. H14-R3]|uniref:nuclear transport factor 2 family protein n=1 Tax=Hymenobacter sp. H14-R3 TaxID=3046308 RepID=UPI0024BB9CA2|nr:nuclear transport factor 2 family protein [Hymenobacter sp. H14-R3]MDJ0365588.1 nuclear transport factor 2 family protein [Hymenobacter sp. H14-R3]